MPDTLPNLQHPIINWIGKAIYVAITNLDLDKRDNITDALIHPYTTIRKVAIKKIIMNKKIEGRDLAGQMEDGLPHRRAEKMLFKEKYLNILLSIVKNLVIFNGRTEKFINGKVYPYDVTALCLEPFIDKDVQQARFVISQLLQNPSYSWIHSIRLSYSVYRLSAKGYIDIIEEFHVNVDTASVVSQIISKEYVDLYTRFNTSSIFINLLKGVTIPFKKFVEFVELINSTK